MKKHIKIIGLLLLVNFTQQVTAFDIERIEPICWWADMKTDLQLMIYGKDLQNSTIKILEDGLAVKAMHKAESPNYLFLDMLVDKPGTYTIEITNGKKKNKVSYTIHERREGSAERKGFTSADAMYLIMPDRFANGDPTNDVLKDSEQKLDRNNLEARHGGDIQGIIDHLDYLADLGITSIWTTPVFEDKLYYHEYGVTDHYKIEPHFGTNELYKKYVEEAHKRGIKAIQDVTPQHCGIGHWWFKDLPFGDWVNDLKLPPYYQRFSLETLSDMHAAKNDQKFTGSTILFETMPDMNLLNPYVLKYMQQWVIWWIEYANLDGLRVDTFFYMGKIGGEWAKAIMNEYPNITLVGEVWGTDPAILSYWIGNSDNYDGFSSHLPMVMDFPLQGAIVKDFSEKDMHWGGRMRTIYNMVAQDFVYKNPTASHVIFADNHDTDRLYNLVGKDKEKAKMAMTLIATTRGLPQIFYGGELMFEDDEKGGPHKARPDFLGGWKEDAVNLFDEKYRTPDQQDMFNHTRTLLQFRKKTPVLHTGKLMHYIPLNDVYTYFRYDDNETVMVIINASSSPQSTDWNRFEERLSEKKHGINIFNGETIECGKELEVPAKSSMVIHFQ